MDAQQTKALLEKCEEIIRAGQIDKARGLLNAINVAQVKDLFRQPLALMCRRVGLYNLGIRILTPPLLDDRDKWIVQAPAAEVAEYAILLQRIGLVNQALGILNRVDSSLLPDTLLYRALCHFNRWEYDEAVPVLEKFVTTPLTDYRLCLGQVNLIAALIGAEQFDKAEPLVKEVLGFTASNGFGRLEANCHELASQIYIQRKEFSAAKNSLHSAEKILKSSDTLDALFIKKGFSIISALEKNAKEPLLEFRAEALRQRDWESVRESDLYLLKIDFEQSRFDNLIFGSPLPAYRRRVYKTLGRQPVSEVYVFGDPSADQMDLMSGRIHGSRTLRAGSKTHQTIEILLRDLYKPLSLGGLFAELFPDEYFNAYSSPDRVHQILRRTRKWLKDNELPIQIYEDQQTYAIHMTGPFAFRCPLHRGIVNWHEVHLRRLEDSPNANRKLRTDQLKNVIGLKGSPFRRFADWAVNSGRLDRVGSGPATSYKLKKAS